LSYIKYSSCDKGGSYEENTCCCRYAEGFCRWGSGVEGVDAVCKVMEDMREEAIEKDKIERVKKLLKLRKLTLEEIADTMEMNIDKVREISMMKPI